MSWVALWYQPGGHWSEAEIITHIIRSVERLVAVRGRQEAAPAPRR